MTGQDVLDLALSVWRDIGDIGNTDLYELALNLALLVLIVTVAGYALRILFNLLRDVWRIAFVQPYHMTVTPLRYRLRSAISRKRIKRQREQEAEKSKRWQRYHEAKHEYEKWEKDEERERQRREILEALKIQK
jgi:hypothetical protein